MYLWVFHLIRLNGWFIQEFSKLGIQWYHFFRSDPENSEYQSIPICYNAFFFINVEFLYFCMLNWSSLFCGFNTIN